MPKKEGNVPPTVIHALPSFVEALPQEDILMRSTFEVDGEVMHYAVFLQNDEVLLACGHHLYKATTLSNPDYTGNVSLSPPAVRVGRPCLETQWENDTLHMNFTIPLIVQVQGKIDRGELNAAFAALHQFAHHPIQDAHLEIKAQLITVANISGQTHYQNEAWSVGLSRLTPATGSVALK